jgi:penicillin-binding protein 1C
LLDGLAPPTFPDPMRTGEPVLRYTVDRVTGLRASAECTHDSLVDMESPLWPTRLEPWLDEATRRASAPRWQPGCERVAAGTTQLAIVGANNGEAIHRTYAGAVPRIHLSTSGAQGAIGWVVNGVLVGTADAGQGRTIELAQPGDYAITAFDRKGKYDRIVLSVQ